jgi:hypothetical protein
MVERSPCERTDGVLATNLTGLVDRSLRWEQLLTDRSVTRPIVVPHGDLCGSLHLFAPPAAAARAKMA